MHYDMKKIGERIRQLRKQLSYTQEEFAKALNTDRSNLSRIEAGTRGPSIDLLVQLSTVFGASLDYIVLGQSGSAADTEKKQHLQEMIEQMVMQFETLKSLL